MTENIIPFPKSGDYTLTPTESLAFDLATEVFMEFGHQSEERARVFERICHVADNVGKVPKEDSYRLLVGIAADLVTKYFSWPNNEGPEGA